MVNYQRKLDAVCVLLEDDQKAANSGQGGRVLPVIVSTETLASNIYQAVRESIHASKSSTFTSKSLLSYIRQKYPDMAKRAADLSNPLWRMRKAGVIKVVRQGSGRKPSTYRINPENFIDPPETNRAASKPIANNNVLPP